MRRPSLFIFFFFNDTATTEIYTLSLHDALPISITPSSNPSGAASNTKSSTISASPPSPKHATPSSPRSEEHTSELQSQSNLVCRLLLEKKKNNRNHTHSQSTVYSITHYIPSHFP